MKKWISRGIFKRSFALLLVFMTLVSMMPSVSAGFQYGGTGSSTPTSGSKSDVSSIPYVKSGVSYNMLGYRYSLVYSDTGEYYVATVGDTTATTGAIDIRADFNSEETKNSSCTLRYPGLTNGDRNFSTDCGTVVGYKTSVGFNGQKRLNALDWNKAYTSGKLTASSTLQWNDLNNKSNNYLYGTLYQKKLYDNGIITKFSDSLIQPVSSTDMKTWLDTDTGGANYLAIQNLIIKCATGKALASVNSEYHSAIAGTSLLIEPLYALTVRLPG